MSEKKPVSILIARSREHQIKKIAARLTTLYDLEVVHYDEIGTPSIEGRVDPTHLAEIENFMGVLCVTEEEEVFTGLKEPAPAGAGNGL